MINILTNHYIQDLHVTDARLSTTSCKTHLQRNAVRHHAAHNAARRFGHIFTAYGSQIVHLHVHQPQCYINCIRVNKNIMWVTYQNILNGYESNILKSCNLSPRSDRVLGL